MNPDSLMARYWLERERRARGEHTGLRALAPVLSGLKSECCGAKVTPNRLEELVCTRCNGVCDGQSWHAARAEAQRGDPLALSGRVVDKRYQSNATMAVRETRPIARDREDQLRAREADRYLEYARLAALIEPRPPHIDGKRWVWVLHAWGWYLMLGSAQLTAERGDRVLPHLGPWSASSVLRACDLGRPVVTRRAQRPRTRAWARVQQDHAPCAIAEVTLH